VKARIRLDTPAVMNLRGSVAEIWKEIGSYEAIEALALTEYIKGKMRLYQYAALFQLAKQYDGGRILEIGCLYGRSTLTLAMAAPTAEITTLTPDEQEALATEKNTEGRNVTVVRAMSWDYLKTNRNAWDMIYVDGDHRQAMKDLPWFNRLRAKGLILYHDYTGVDTLTRPQIEVYEAISQLGLKLGRDPDVMIVDTDELIGMAGFYRRAGEQWLPTSS
jgi:predicted O-methyltransferase YrrM